MEVAGMKLLSVYDKAFRKYGSVLQGYDWSDLFEELRRLPCQEEGVTYVASVEALENCAGFSAMKNRGFGGMDIQIGYVGGKNKILNCLEYHKSSEFNIAADDVVLVLGLEADITDGTYDLEKTEAFLLPAGVGVELFATTLHYAPFGCSEEENYHVACVLPRGTNEERPPIEPESVEDRMCFGRNKWMLAHPEAPEAKNGACIGLTGENIRY